MSEAVTLCLVIALQKLVKPVVRRDSYGGLFVIKDYNIASWTKDKVNYNRISKFNTNKHRQVLHGQIWFCDLGYNVGTEKNKMRPVLVMSNNKINNSEKVVVVCITDAKGKVNAR